MNNDRHPKKADAIALIVVFLVAAVVFGSESHRVWQSGSRLLAFTVGTFALAMALIGFSILRRITDGRTS